MMQNVDELIQACKSQNKMAQKQLYKLLRPYLRAIAFRYLRDTSFVNDTLQETFVKVFLGIDKYDSNKASIKQWAARITINVCINYNRRVIGTPSEELVILAHDTPIVPAAYKEMSDEYFLEILKLMPDNYAEVFNLFVIDEFDHQEIAEILGITVELSRKRLSRARSWLKKTFSKNQNNIIRHTA